MSTITRRPVRVVTIRLSNTSGELDCRRVVCQRRWSDGDEGLAIKTAAVELLATSAGAGRRGMSGELIRYDAMCRAIAEAHAVDEVKDIRDKARALEMYAHQAQNTEAERQAAEIRFRAEVWGADRRPRDSTGRAHGLNFIPRGNEVRRIVGCRHHPQASLAMGAPRGHPCG
jgi:hypothetical protein